MTAASIGTGPLVWREPPAAWLALAAAALLLYAVFRIGVDEMIRIWGIREEYSYGYAVPFVSAFLAWQRKNELERIAFRGAWSGVAVIVAGLAMLAVGMLSTITLFMQYSFLLALAGLVLAYAGRQGLRVLAVPLVMLVFMIPLPLFIMNELSYSLQLLSSKLGVMLIRACDVSVFLDGNIVDLGSYKLQVVEACSGLRYLLPLMTLGFIAAYFFKAPLWQRAIVFLSTIPITIFMNSFRIGVIGLTVQYWGVSAADGFLHDFEGWAVFMLCCVILAIEMRLLLAHRGSRPLQEVFGLERPAPTPANAIIRYRSVSAPLVTALGVLALAAAVSAAIPERVPEQPPRRSFAEFPLEIGSWRGRPERLPPEHLAILNVDDYLFANYAAGDNRPVNFFVSYYAVQSKGQSAHSPRACIPGDGWAITSFTRLPIEGARVGDAPLHVNRALIQKGDIRQLVYYWFQQRERVVTNEYLVKWFIFRDALARNRSDGALVRLVAPLAPAETEAAGDARLAEFARAVAPLIPRYVPQ